jgi:hypothetical protein
MRFTKLRDCPDAEHAAALSSSRELLADVERAR